VTLALMGTLRLDCAAVSLVRDGQPLPRGRDSATGNV
jgi:hypothetical protein